MDLERTDLRFLISNYKNCFDKDMFNIKSELKVAFLLMHSMDGKYNLGFRFPIEVGKVSQKKLKEFLSSVKLTDEEFNIQRNLFNYIVLTLSAKEGCFSNQHTHVANKIFALSEVLFFEKLHDLKGVSFFKHIKKEILLENPKVEDIQNLFEYLSDYKGEIRNNLMLMFIRNQELLYLEEFNLNEIYMYQMKK